MTELTHLHEQIRFATDNLRCAWGFGLYNVTGSHLNVQNYWNQFNCKPLLVCARLYINEFVSDMF